MTFLKWQDYLICCMTLVVSLGVGLFYSLKDKKQKTTSRYLYGDGKMCLFPVAMSLVVSYVSGIVMLGVPAEVYMYGMQWYISQVGYFTVSLVAMNVLIPPLKRLNITSIHQYLELRYGSRKLRLFVTLLDMLSMVNYLGFVVFIPAVTLNAVSDIPKDWSINVIMAVVVVYTLIGGFKAVVWTDVFQTFLMIGGIFSILIKGTLDVGGIQTTWKTVAEKGRLNFFNFNPDPTIRQSFWSLFVGSMISGMDMQYYQACFQRIKATRTESSAKRMYLMAQFGFLIIALLTALEGLVMFAYYDVKGCDPLVNNEVINQNQLIVKMVTDIFDNIPCLPGLFVTALFSASLSTMSSMLISLSALFLEDIVKPHMKPLSVKKAYMITQVSVFLFGGFGIFVSYMAFSLEGPVTQILETTESCFKGAAAGIYLLAWFVPRSTATGAFVGGFLSSVLVGWISYGKYTSAGLRQSPTLKPASMDKCMTYNVSEAVWNPAFYHNLNKTHFETNTTTLHEPKGVDLLYSISYKWLATISISIVLVFGSIISRLQGKREVDPTLVVSVWDIFSCVIPRRIPGKQNKVVARQESNDWRDELQELVNL